MERVLVTGGAGFIGSHTVELLLERGYSVRVLDNLSLGKREWVGPEVEFIEADIRDMDACRKATLGCVGVFHLAAMSRSAASLDNVDICTSNNILGTQNVLTAARENGLSKVVYAGSSTFYGNQKPPHKETTSSDFLNFYGLSKYVAEEYCLMFDRTYNLPAVVMRYFNVYGPRLSGEGVYALVVSIFLRQKREGRPLTIHGSGEQRRDFIHVSDVARANIMAFESPVRGRIFNVGSGISVSVKEIADKISSDHVYEARRQGDAEITLADISRIQSELNWYPEVSLDDGLNELLNAEAEHVQYARK